MIQLWAWAIIGIGAGVGFARLERWCRRPRMYRYPLRPELLEHRAFLGGKPLRVNVAVGAKMSAEAWEVVSLKLLDLTGDGMTYGERRAVQRFITRSVRAWSDLEQRVKGTPDAPAAPTE